MFDVFFFKQKTAYEMRISDWSSDVCSSDLIETVAHNTPDKIHTIVIDPATGLMPHHGRAVAAALALEGDLARQAAKVLAGLYNAFLATDAEQIEINPLAVRSEEHTSELQSLMRISYAVFCLKKKKDKTHRTNYIHTDLHENTIQHI